MAGVSINTKGTLFGRYVRALIVGEGDAYNARCYAEGQGHGWTDVAASLKAVSEMATGDDGALTTPVSFDFAEALRGRALLSRIAGVRRVPFALRLISTVAGGTAYWVGESVSIPASALDFDHEVVLPYMKLASMNVFTRELGRSSQPNVEQVIAVDTIAAAAQAADEALVDPANSGSASKPASITSTGTEVPSSGSAVADIDKDLGDTIGALNAANISLDSATWLMAPRTCVSLSLMRGTDGAPCYPSITAKGGTLAGIPVLTSRALTTDDSPGTSLIVLLAADELMVADDGQSRIEVSTTASIQLDDAPGAGAQALVSAWQNNIAIVKAQRAISWKMRHTAGCAYISGVQF